MERLRKLRNDDRHPQVPEPRIQLSIGLATCQTAFTDAIAWLNDADKALSIAKNTGRYKISATSPPPSGGSTTRISA